MGVKGHVMLKVSHVTAEISSGGLDFQILPHLISWSVPANEHELIGVVEEFQ